MPRIFKPTTVRAGLPATISETERLFFLNALCGDTVAEIIERNVARAARAGKAKAIADADGNVALWVWSRDCDCCEGTSRYVVKAEDIEAESARLYDGAEGPMSITLHATSEPFKAESRDRALEAFEDGHPYAIYD